MTTKRITKMKDPEAVERGKKSWQKTLEKHTAKILAEREKSQSQPTSEVSSQSTSEVSSQSTSEVSTQPTSKLQPTSEVSSQPTSQSTSQSNALPDQNLVLICGGIAALAAFTYGKFCKTTEKTEKPPAPVEKKTESPEEKPKEKVYADFKMRT